MSIDFLQSDVECLDVWINQFHNMDDHSICQVSQHDLDDSFDGDQESFDVVQNEISSEIQQAFILDMYNEAIVYFAKVHFSDLLSQFRDEHRVKEEQPLRVQLKVGEKVKKTKFISMSCVQPRMQIILQKCW